MELLIVVAVIGIAAIAIPSIGSVTNASKTGPTSATREKATLITSAITGRLPRRGFILAS